MFFKLFAYRIRAGKPYVVHKLTYEMNDPTVAEFVRKDSARSFLHNEMRLDVNVLDAERQRITNGLMSNGYYRFNKDFIVYQALYVTAGLWVKIRSSL